MCRDLGRGTWGRFHLPSVRSIESSTLVVAGLLLVLSGCTAQKNAVSSSAKSTVSPIAKSTVSSGAKSAVTPVPTESTQPTHNGTALIATLAPEKPNTTGTGTAVVRLDPQKQEVCYTLHVSGIELPATAAQIHRVGAGGNGSVVVSVMPPNAQGVSNGCVHASHDLIVAIQQHSADYYVTVHNAPYPAGALRGQFSVCTTHSGC